MADPLSRLYKSTLTCDHTATAYADGDAFGSTTSVSVHELAGRSIRIVQINVIDLEKVTNNDLDIYIFDSSFTAGTDNAAFTLADADAPKLRAAKVEVAAADYVDMGGFEKAFKTGLDIVVPLSGQSLYLQPVAGAAFDSTGTSQVKIEIIYERRD